MTLGSDAGAAGERIESYALAEKKMADGAADRGAVSNGLEGCAFFDVPFYTDSMSIPSTECCG